MSDMRLYLSRRGRLPLLVTFMVLLAIVVVAPGANAARNAVKQFKASINPPTAVGQTAGSWMETIQNCGPASAPPCDGTHPSTINLGTFQIAVPAEFRPITLAANTPTFPSGQPTRHWTVSYSNTGTINGFANGGTDKLIPGESIMITFSATPSTCTGTEVFTTSAWGSTPAPGTDPFTNQSPQADYTVTISGCGVQNGGTVSGPNNQTETITGGFEGYVNVSFDANGALSCKDVPTYGSQWNLYHAPDQVTITPGLGYVEHGPKIDTTKFPAVSGNDSSWYLVCYAVPKDDAHPTGFATKGGGTASDTLLPGYWVGILPSCYETAGVPPCVSEQFKGLPGSDDEGKFVITTLLPGGDPLKH